MRATAQYTIGNTAVKIVDTGRRIRVINIEQQQIRIQFAKTVLCIIFCAVLTLFSALLLVNYHSSKTLLDKNIYSLKTEIEVLERENTVLQRSIDETEPNYEDILDRAHELGMDFPTNDRVETYQYKKGTGIKYYPNK